MAGTSPLEVVFSFNTAGAYGSVPHASRKYLKDLIRCMDAELIHRILTTLDGVSSPTSQSQTISSPSTTAKPRVAIFAHGACDLVSSSNYGIKHVDFSDCVTELTHFVDSASPLRWGSVCHCYEMVLRKARALSWTPLSRRALVLVGCTRCHYGRHPGSAERIHWHIEARCLAQMGVKVFTVEPVIGEKYHEFYPVVAEMTEGCHVILKQCTQMHDVILAIVSHLAGPSSLEDFEQEVLDRADGSFTTDMAQLFATLRQHDDIMMTSFPQDAADRPSTPPGGDFDVALDDDLDDDSVSEALEQEFVSSLKRRSSVRLKNKAVKFFLPDNDDANDDDGAQQSPMTSSHLGAAPVRVTTDVTSRPLFKKSQTMAMGLGRRKEKVVEGSNSRKRPSLRKGVTVSCGMGSKRSTSALTGGRSFCEPYGAKVYEIDPEAPARREDVAEAAFTLRHLSWTPWTLVISPNPPSRATSQWQARSPDDTRGGYLKKNVFPDNDDDEDSNDAPALYEVALGKNEGDAAAENRVVYHKFLPALTPNETEIESETSSSTSTWASQIFGDGQQGVVMDEVDDAIRKKCGVFLRRAPFSHRARRVDAVMQAHLSKHDYAWKKGVHGLDAVMRSALRKYDYAWNDSVQGLHRAACRRVEWK